MRKVGVLLLLGLVGILTLFHCKPKEKRILPEAERAALATYVPTGELDEYYMFASGGHSGQIYVVGIPSMREIRTIPVFTPDPATGHGYDERTRKLLGGYTWGDVHHPALSETDGDYDGRWLFVNDCANARIARINLKTFYVEEIIGPLPNVSGLHAGCFVTPNTEYVWAATRFSIPIPRGTYVPAEQYAERYKAVICAIKVHPKTGKMSVAWELALPPVDFDLSDAGKEVSYGWAFFTCYNSELAHSELEVMASMKDRDFILAVNWKEVEKAVAAGKYKIIGGAKVVDPAKVPGLCYWFPVPKSPHGVDVSPNGRYICAGGKLSPIVPVYDFLKIQEAIKKKDFEGEFGGIPVLRYEAVNVAEVPVGLGPLHTQFDDKGFAYTSLFVESAVAKWRVGEPWDVVDKIQIHYNIGHLAACEGDTRHPDGKYLVALNKLSKDRFLPVGPSHPENHQLIDISGEKMTLLYDSPSDPEPHYAQIIKADKLNPISVFPKEPDRPYSTWRAEDAKIVRGSKRVDVYMIAVRSRFVPDIVEVSYGDTVYFHVTNIEDDVDITHGFGICFYNVDMQVEPRETRTIKIVANKRGVYPFYCTNFCSALHQEMQGYLLVK